MSAENEVHHSHEDGHLDEFDDYFNELYGPNDGILDDDDFLDIYDLSPRQRLVHRLRRGYNQIAAHYSALPAWQKIALVIGGSFIGFLGLMMVVFHETIFESVVSKSNELHDKWSTKFVLVILIFAVAFPPMIGFSLVSTITGLIYGVSFTGWFILAFGAVSGSICAFILFKTLLHSKAEKLIHMNKRFEAFASILQEDNSYLILALFRLCPFPYSLTNGAISSVYGVTVRNFAIANIITTPKLLAYLFVGSRIKNLAETDSAGSKLFDIISIVVTLAATTLTAWVLYLKTKKKFAQMQGQRNPTTDLTIDPSFEI